MNVSTRCLLDPDLPDQVAERLAAWQVPAGSLVLEVTESAVIADPARALDVLGRLHEQGVGLALDDFGTGYSSMAYLKALPVDELKVDRSFGLRRGVVRLPPWPTTNSLRIASGNSSAAKPT